MSPEQAAGRLDLLGPASDVYSLGATLYCLLTGRPAITDSNVLDALQKVKKGDFPAPRLVKREVAPALEAICLKAMALKPADRYGSPRELAEDVEHWLADEHVSALPESAMQRLARWGRRHRALTRAATITLALVAVVSVLATLLVNSAWRAEQDARDREQSARQGAEEAFRQSVGHLNETLVLLSDGELRDVRGLEPLRKKLDVYSHALAQQHGDDPRLQPEAALLYFCLGLLTVRDGSKDEALEQFLRAKTICKKLAGDFPDVPRHRELLARACLGSGILRRSLGQSPEATAEYDLALAELHRLCAADPANLDYRRHQAEVLHNQADLADSLGDWDKALVLYLESIRMRDGLVANRPTDVNFRRDQARGYGYIGDVYTELCRWQEAETAYKRADEIRLALFEEHPGNAEAKWQLARSYNNTAMLYRGMGRSAEALVKFETPLKMFEELAAAYPEVKDYRDDLGWTLNRVGALRTDPADPSGGRAELERAQAIYEQLLRIDPNDVGYRSGLAWSLAYLGKWHMDSDARRALAYLSVALRHLEKLSGDRSNADNMYAMAMVEALTAEQTDKDQDKRDRLIAQAFDHLEQATRRGEVPVARVERDRGFQVLRDQQRFQKLVQKMKEEDKAKGRASS
jgi:serine/threonine-protein kinase